MPVGDSLKLIGKGLKTSRVYEPILNSQQIAALETSPEVTIFTVWVSAAGDAQEESGCLERVVETVNREVASKLGLMLELERWENRERQGSSTERNG